MADPGAFEKLKLVVESAAYQHDGTPMSPLGPWAFSVFARWLLYECPLGSCHDVDAYLARRRLLEPAIAAGWGGLPRPSEQSRVLSRIAKRLPPGWLPASGMVVDDGQGLRFANPGARVIIPWRDAEGSIDTIQRRRIDTQKDRKYVFPSGRNPRYPYGIDRMRDGPLAWVEGAVDTEALRCIRSGVTVLGIPGVSRMSEWAHMANGRENAIGVDVDDGDMAKANVLKALEDAEAAMNAAGATRVRRWKPRSKDWGLQWEQMR